MSEIGSIFNFLKEYNELSNPVVTKIDEQKWSMKVLNLPSIKELWNVYETKDFDCLKIIEIERPVMKPCPVPNDDIINWIDGDWRNLNDVTIKHKVVIERIITNEDESVEIIQVNFDDNANLVSLYENFLKVRNHWRNEEIPKNQGLDIYNQLFKLYSDMKKEAGSYELVLGDGHISWLTNSVKIDHPSLLQRVQIEFDPEKPSFVIKCDELITELYTPMLRIIPTINQIMLSDMIQDIEIKGYHIADTNNTIGLFKRLISVIDESGKYVETIDNGFGGPKITSSPVLFLRKRTLGYSMFIDKIIKDIESKKNRTIPYFFKNMIGEYVEENAFDDTGENWNHNGIDQEILLTLPANNEQLTIIKYLNNFGAVLVQGPPGTGKTHSIANLIGHLLSQGKSVLVTSHTEKALSVLKDKVYKDKNDKDINLQSLCISLLSSNSQKKEMDDAINEIAIKGTTLDLNESKKKIEKLEKERIQLIENLMTKTQELLQIRSLEYKDIVYSNQTMTPTEAAKFIYSGIDKYDYLNGVTTNDTIGLPLSIDDLQFLYHSNQIISREEEEILSKELPRITCLWDVETFEKNKTKYDKFDSDLFGWSPTLLFKNTIGEEALLKLLETTKIIKSSLDNMEDYQLIIIDKTIKNSIYTQPWNEYFDEFNILISSYEKYRNIYINNDYIIPDNLISEESITVLIEITASGKEIPVTLFTAIAKPKWKKIRDQVTNNRKIIEKKIDFENIKTIIQYMLMKKNVLNKFNKLLSEVSKIEVLTFDNFEEEAAQYNNKISTSIKWYTEVWKEFAGDIAGACADNVKFDEICVIDFSQPIKSIRIIIEEVFIADLSNRIMFNLFNEFNRKMDDYLLYLCKYKANGKLFEDLYYSVKRKDDKIYRNSYESIHELLLKVETYSKRSELLKELNQIAPAWSQTFKDRIGIHGEGDLPENIELAWKWLQMSNQLSRIDGYDPNLVQKDINKINEQLVKNATRLAYEKAWYNKIIKRTPEQTQAIEGWRQTIRQIGKAKGKRAPTLQKDARELMPLCQTAIPVWIMPLNRVVDNFDPQKNTFDVVIIDEASQADILALSVLYLGKKVIIVGDDEQVSPDPIGLKTEDINALIEQHLQDIPNKHLFNDRTSLYDMAKASGFKPVMLTEHFRCLPEIIEFSNQLSYGGKIKPLRDTSNVILKPPVINYRIQNACRNDNKINEIEAKHIASIICAYTEDPAFKKMTIGVISLLGHEQPNEIQRLLLENMDSKVYDEHQIQCGTPAQFQGDERDIIFLSIVDGPNVKGGTARLLSEDGNNDANRKKYNVAASRAKDQMWIVYSLNPEIDLKPDDIRLRLIRHAINPSIDKNEEKLKTAESDFEFRVMNSLLNHGYNVTPQWKVGAYRIDMIVEDGDNHIALECDGERWHTQDNLSIDLKRQAILERLGWRFIRIRGSVYYRDPEKTMKWVFNELENNNVKPNYKATGTGDETEIETHYEMIEKIKRRAEQIRREWQNKIVENQLLIDLKRNDESIENRITSRDIVPENESEENIEKFLKKQKAQSQTETTIVASDSETATFLAEAQMNRIKNDKDTLEFIPQIIESSAVTSDAIIQLLESKGLNFIDKRDKGGVLWVVGEYDLKDTMNELKQKGYKFTFAPYGGKATKRQAAWWRK